MKTIVSAIASAAASVLILIVVARGIHIAEYGLNASKFDLKQGQLIFSNRCARCHIVTGNAADIGPNLSQIGHVASKRRPGMTGAGYILESILKPRAFKSPGSSGEMPVNLVNSYGDDEIRNLVAFLCSQGASSVDDEIRALKIERPPVDDVKHHFDSAQVLRGESLYRGKAGCAVCHPFYSGSPNELLAPYLFYRGYKDRAKLRRAIVAPHEEVAPRYRQSTVVLNNGQTRTGQLLSRDQSRVMLFMRNNSDVSVTEIPCSEIEIDENSNALVEHTTISAMPTGYDVVLNAGELDDLLAFILSMN